MVNIKCTFVGSQFVGKSNLIKTFLTSSNQGIYQFSIFDDYYVDFMYENTIVHLKIQNMPNETIEDLCESIFRKTSIFIACFSLANPHSLEEINFYVNYIKKRFSNSIFILAGLQSDIRDDLLDQKKGNFPDWFFPIESEKGKQKKIEINALDYIECSSKNCYNVQKVFELAIKYSIKYSKQNNISNGINSCCNVY